MANILIAGCGGIGSKLGIQLKQNGHRVFGIRRDISKLPNEIEPIEADLSTPITNLPKAIDYVFYTASAGL